MGQAPVKGLGIGQSEEGLKKAGLKGKLDEHQVCAQTIAGAA